MITRFKSEFNTFDYTTRLLSNNTINAMVERILGISFGKIINDFSIKDKSLAREYIIPEFQDNTSAGNKIIKGVFSGVHSINTMKRPSNINDDLNMFDSYINSLYNQYDEYSYLCSINTSEDASHTMQTGADYSHHTFLFPVYIDISGDLNDSKISDYTNYAFKYIKDLEVDISFGKYPYGNRDWDTDEVVRIGAYMNHFDFINGGYQQKRMAQTFGPWDNSPTYTFADTTQGKDGELAGIQQLNSLTWTKTKWTRKRNSRGNHNLRYKVHFLDNPKILKNKGELLYKGEDYETLSETYTDMIWGVTKKMIGSRSITNHNYSASHYTPYYLRYPQQNGFDNEKPRVTGKEIGGKHRRKFNEWTINENKQWEDTYTMPNSILPSSEYIVGALPNFPSVYIDFIKTGRTMNHEIKKGYNNTYANYAGEFGNMLCIGHIRIQTYSSIVIGSRNRIKEGINIYSHSPSFKGFRYNENTDDAYFTATFRIPRFGTNINTQSNDNVIIRLYMLDNKYEEINKNKSNIEALRIAPIIPENRVNTYTAKHHRIIRYSYTNRDTFSKDINIIENVFTKRAIHDFGGWLFPPLRFGMNWYINNKNFSSPRTSLMVNGCFIKTLVSHQDRNPNFDFDGYYRPLAYYANGRVGINGTYNQILGNEDLQEYDGGDSLDDL